MSENKAGSYPFKDLNSVNDELIRLKAQARIGLELERQIWAALGLQPKHHVLDLACGPGITSCALANIVSQGSVTGVDISDELLQEAEKEANQQSCSNVHFQKADVYDLKLPDETFDFVYARFLFQHLTDPLKALREIKRVMKKGGSLCIVDVDDGFTAYYPEPEGFTELLEQANRVQKSNGGDRLIGRKLKSYFVNESFREPKIDLIPVTSDSLGKKNFVDITTGFKAKQLGFEDEKKTSSILNRIYQWAENEESWAVSCVFVASAKKD